MVQINASPIICACLCIMLCVQTPLQKACGEPLYLCYRQRSEIQELLQQGAYPNGNHILARAIENCRPEDIRALLAAGAVIQVSVRLAHSMALPCLRMSSHVSSV